MTESRVSFRDVHVFFSNCNSSCLINHRTNVGILTTVLYIHSNYILRDKGNYCKKDLWTKWTCRGKV